MQTADTNHAMATASPAPIEVRQPVETLRHPKGIYRALLPIQGGVEQVVHFYPDLTYRLQERYSKSRDSIVTTTGTWAPSNGFIWLYKEQVVRGRYQWVNDALHYYSPVTEKRYPMEQPPDILARPVWKEKRKSGVHLYGIGNEPFWNIELRDSVHFRLADWSANVSLPLQSSTPGRDSSVYLAGNDSLSLRLTIFSYYCSDGMSDFIYRNAIRIVYNGKKFEGCGVQFRAD